MAVDAVLLACFDFPPNGGIGGRRWAKFAKGLALQNTTVHVIKADPVKGDTSSTWSDDLDHERIIVHSLKRRYPRVISHGPKNLAGKVRYRLALSKLKNKYPGTPYDIALGWERDFMKKASAIIENFGITKVIATGAPFNLLVYASELKKRLPNLELIVDYRDPWITAQNYGMKGLNDQQRSVETMKQELVFQQANWVTCPNEFLLSDIRSSAVEKPRSQFYVLPHFYDPDDVTPFLDAPPRKDDQIRLIYGGAVYIGMEKHLERLRSALIFLRSNHPALFSRIRIEIYTSHRDQEALFSEFQDTIAFKKPIGKEFFSKLATSDAAFIFLAEHNRNFLTTKFFEYLPFRKPLIYLGPSGYVSDFIEEHQLGMSLKSDEQFVSMIGRIAQKTQVVDDQFDLSTFSLERRTKELLALFR